MKFILKTAGDLYKNGKHFERLKIFGFEFKPTTYRNYNWSKLDLYDDKNPTIEFDTLEELIMWSKENEFHSLIIETFHKTPSIEIYDDYRE